MARYHATVNGNVPFSQEEEVQRDLDEADESMLNAKREILRQISALEISITLRRQRESILGTDNGWLANVDAQIAALRAQL